MKLIDKNNLLKTNLDNSNYLNSLLSLSLKYKIINSSTYNLIINKILFLLKYKLEKITLDTSTVSYTTILNINNSNLYTLGLYLQKYDYLSLNLLINEDIVNLYKTSLNYLNNYVNLTKLLYKIVLNNKIKTNNYFYNTTLDLGIKAFFKNYNPSFDSLNKIITADYIPLKANTNLGITFIYNYLESINLENKFLNQFNLENLNLDSNLPINLAYFVLELVIILKYLKLDIYSLTTSIDFSSLYQEYELNSQGYLNKLNKTYKELKSLLDLTYMDKFSQDIISNIYNHTRNKSLNTLINLDEKEIIYQTNNKMTDLEFLNLVNTNNYNLIKSFLDLVDYLDIKELREDELFKIFSNLKLIDLMALKKYYCLSNSYVLDSLNRFIYMKSIKEQELINSYYKYIKLA